MIKTIQLNNNLKSMCPSPSALHSAATTDYIMPTSLGVVVFLYWHDDAASAVDATLYHRRPGVSRFPAAAARAWNSLPPATKAANSLLQFRRETKTHLFHQSFLD